MYETIKADVAKSGKSVDPDYLNYVREALFGGDRATDSLSRDEVRLLLQYRNRQGEGAMAQMQLEFRKIIAIKQTGQLADQADAGLIKGLKKFFHHDSVMKTTVNKLADLQRHQDWESSIDAVARTALGKFRSLLGEAHKGIFGDANAEAVLLSHMKQMALTFGDAFGKDAGIDSPLGKLAARADLRALAQFGTSHPAELALLARSGIDILGDGKPLTEDRLLALAETLRGCLPKLDSDPFMLCKNLRDLALARIGKETVDSLVGSGDIYEASNAALGKISAGLLSALADRDVPKGFAELLDIGVKNRKVSSAERDALIHFLDANKGFRATFDQILRRLDNEFVQNHKTGLLRDVEVVRSMFVNVAAKVAGFAKSGYGNEGFGYFLTSFMGRMSNREEVGSFVKESLNKLRSMGEFMDNYLHPFLIDIKDRAESAELKSSAGKTEEQLKANGYDPATHTNLAALLEKFSRKDGGSVSESRLEAEKNAKAPFLRYQYGLLSAVLLKCKSDDSGWDLENAERILSNPQEMENLKIKAFVDALNYGNTSEGRPSGEVRYDTPFRTAALSPDGTVKRHRMDLLRQLTLPTVEKCLRRLGLEKLDGNEKTFREMCNSVSPAILKFADSSVLQSLSDDDIGLLIEKKIDFVSVREKGLEDIKKTKKYIFPRDYIAIFMNRIRAGDNVDAASKAALDLVQLTPDKVGLELDQDFGKLFDKLKLRYPDILNAKTEAGKSDCEFLKTLISTLKEEAGEKFRTTAGGPDQKRIGRFVDGLIESEGLLQWVDGLHAGKGKDVKAACEKLVDSTLRIEAEFGSFRADFDGYMVKYSCHVKSKLLSPSDVGLRLGFNSSDLKFPGMYDLFADGAKIRETSEKLRAKIDGRLGIVSHLENELNKSGVLPGRKAAIRAALGLVLNASQGMFVGADAADRLVGFLERTSENLRAAVGRVRKLRADGKPVTQEFAGALAAFFAGVFDDFLNPGILDGSLFARGDVPDSPRVQNFISDLFVAVMSINSGFAVELHGALAETEASDDKGSLRAPIRESVMQQLDNAHKQANGMAILLDWITSGQLGYALSGLFPGEVLDEIKKYPTLLERPFPPKEVYGNPDSEDLKNHLQKSFSGIGPRSEDAMDGDVKTRGGYLIEGDQKLIRNSDNDDETTLSRKAILRGFLSQTFFDFAIRESFLEALGVPGWNMFPNPSVGDEKFFKIGIEQKGVDTGSYRISYEINAVPISMVQTRTEEAGCSYKPEGGTFSCKFQLDVNFSKLDNGHSGAKFKVNVAGIDNMKIDFGTIKPGSLNVVSFGEE